MRWKTLLRLDYPNRLKRQSMNCVRRLDYKYVTTVNMIPSLFIVIYYFERFLSKMAAFPFCSEAHSNLTFKIPDWLWKVRPAKPDFVFLLIRACSRDAFKVSLLIVFCIAAGESRNTQLYVNLLSWATSNRLVEEKVSGSLTIPQGDPTTPVRYTVSRVKFLWGFRKNCRANFSPSKQPLSLEARALTKL